MSDSKTGDIKTGETKPRRAVRGLAPSQADIGADAVAEAVASVTAPILEHIERNVTPEPEPASVIAMAQAVPAGPACPVPGAAEPSPGEKPPISDKSPSDKSPDAATETAWTAFAEAQAALARGFEKAAVEMNGISHSGVAATADAAVALLGARTFAEALEIHAALARRGIDTMFAASARMSEIGAKTVADASRPLLSRYARRWDSLGTS